MIYFNFYHNDNIIDVLINFIQLNLDFSRANLKPVNNYLQEPGTICWIKKPPMDMSLFKWVIIPPVNNICCKPGCHFQKVLPCFGILNTKPFHEDYYN